MTRYSESDNHDIGRKLIHRIVVVGSTYIIPSKRHDGIDLDSMAKGTSVESSW